MPHEHLDVQKVKYFSTLLSVNNAIYAVKMYFPIYQFLKLFFKPHSYITITISIVRTCGL